MFPWIWLLCNSLLAHVRWFHRRRLIHTIIQVCCNEYQTFRKFSYSRQRQKVYIHPLQQTLSNYQPSLRPNSKRRPVNVVNQAIWSDDMICGFIQSSYLLLTFNRVNCFFSSFIIYRVDFSKSRLCTVMQCGPVVTRCDISRLQYTNQRYGKYCSLKCILPDINLTNNQWIIELNQIERVETMQRYINVHR